MYRVRGQCKELASKIRCYVVSFRHILWEQRISTGGLELYCTLIFFAFCSRRTYTQLDFVQIILLALHIRCIIPRELIDLVLINFIRSTLQPLDSVPLVLDYATLEFQEASYYHEDI